MLKVKPVTGYRGCMTIQQKWPKCPGDLKLVVSILKPRQTCYYYKR